MEQARSVTAGDKQEAQEGDDRNERRARSGSDVLASDVLFSFNQYAFYDMIASQWFYNIIAVDTSLTRTPNVIEPSVGIV